MGNVWQYVGELKDGLKVYLSPDRAYVVSRGDDIRWVPTAEELEEIHLTYGSREARVAGEKVSLQAVTAAAREVAALSATITALRLEALEMEKEIERLMLAIKKRTRL
ncbi:hypothetical protein ES705_26691 [subsurface metagenome]